MCAIVTNSRIKNILTVLFVILTAGSAYSQNSDPKLLGKFLDGDVSEFNYRIINKAFGEKPGRLVLRICSNDDLLTAIALAAGMGVTSDEESGLAAGLKRLRYSGKGVFYSVYSGCESKKERFNSVEYWLVPPGVQLEVDRQISADEVNFRSLRPESNEEFASTLEHLKESETGGSEASRIVLGNYNLAPSKALLKNIKKAKGILKDDARCGTWHFIQLKGTEIWENEPEEDFPTIIIVSKKN